MNDDLLFDRYHMDEAEAVKAFGRSIEIAAAIVREGEIRRYRLF